MEELKDAQNFCRNPDNDSSGPWCYVNKVYTTYEYCFPACVSTAYSIQDTTMMHYINVEPLIID